MDLPTRKRLYQACDPEKDLKPGDPRYVDLDRVPADGGTPPRGAPWTARLRDKILLSDEEPAYLLVTGLRGSGKSTSLNLLVEVLRRDGYLVAFFDADDRLDMFSPLSESDVLLSMLFVAQNEVDEAEGKKGSAGAQLNVFERLWTWMKTTDIEINKADVGLAVGIPGGPKLNAKIAAEFKQRTPLRERVREFFERGPTAFLEQARAAFKELDTRARACGHQALVVIVDSLEHLEGTSTSWTDVMNSAERLFTGGMLRLPVHTMYTVPPPVVLRLPGGYTFIPMVKLHSRDGSAQNAAGFAALRELVAHRIPAASQADLFGSTNAQTSVDALIAASGGYPRALVRLLQEVATVASDEDVVPAVEPKEFDRLIVRTGDSMRQMVRSNGEAIPLLKRVAAEKDLRMDNDEERILAGRMLTSNAILRYSNDNAWWDVHPFVRRIVED